MLQEGDEVVFKEKRADVLIDRKWVEELDIYELGWPIARKGES